MDTCHTPKLDFFTKQNPTPPPPPSLIIWIFIYTLGGHFQNLIGFIPTFNERSQHIWSNIETSTLTRRIFNIWLIPFVGDGPSTYLKKFEKKKKAPQSGTNYFPKVYNLTILFFFFLFLSLRSIRKCAKPLTILLGKLCNPTQ